jgi:glutamyl-tRNA reductase
MVFNKIMIFFMIIGYINSFRYFFGKKTFSHAKTKINLINDKFINNKFCMIGISLHNNTLEDIEKILINKKKLPKFYNNIIKNKIADEIIALSTCNRFELYTYSKNTTETINKLEDILLSNNKKYDYNIEILKKFIYKNKNIDAFKHLIKVSSGINSLIFGEKQIEDQIKKVIESIKEKKNNELEKVFSHALECSSKIRKIENFNSCDISLVSASVDLLTNKINNSTKILIIGSGDTSKLLINYLRNRQITNFSLCNRNETNALKLKNYFNKLNISIINYKNFENLIYDYDYIFMATSSPVPLINYDNLVELHKNVLTKQNKTITIIDLCLPMNVEPKCGEIKNISLFNIDSIKKIQLSNIIKNKNILHEANLIIDNYIDKYRV